MEKTLFPTTELPDYLFEIAYKGPSFDGQMEIVQLEKEITGLNDSLRLVINALHLHQRLGVKPEEIEIYVEAFTKSSFKKRIALKVIKRGAKIIEKYPATSGVIAVVFVGILTAMATLKASEIKELPPTVVAKIGDQVQVQLLQDPRFLRAVANVVSPLSQADDKLVINSPTGTSELEIPQSERSKFILLTDETAAGTIDGTYPEDLEGKVTRVDLDARINHIGFKVENKGNTIAATLVERIPREEMRSLLDRWIMLKGTTTKSGGERMHIDIGSFEVIQAPKQTEIDFEEGKGEEK